MADLKRFFKKTIVQTETKTVPNIPKGLWVKCSKCGEMVYREDVTASSCVCPKCGGYFRIKARTRIRLVADEGSFVEWFTGMTISNPLSFPSYPEKIKELREKTNLDEAVILGECTISGIRTVLGIMDTRFLMGSMGYIVGEKITRAFETAVKRRLPVVLFCCSGGARMQEGMVSLMQMAKTSAAIARHAKEGLLYIPVLTDPTTGGVTASFAMLGDIILAEPGALIGFAGPRVIAQTIGQRLPEGFQKAEFLLEHGFLDAIIPREKMREKLGMLLKMHEYDRGYGNFPLENSARKIETFGKKRPSARKLKKSVSMGTWERVLTARSRTRPVCRDFIRELFDDFTELHGDRAFRDDGAVVGGIAYLDGMPVTVIGIQKGRSTKENLVCNFGMPSPEGYRKAMRLMKQAEKFQRPVITLIDTPGAFCGIEAEERGQGQAIADSLFEMSQLQIPILSVVIGEGGSGGALALGMGNEVWMLENSVYSILSPEGFASVLWKDSKRADEAAELMKMTAAQLKELGIIDRVIPEEVPACEENLDEICEYLKISIKKFLREQSGKTGMQFAEERYIRFRNM